MSSRVRAAYRTGRSGRVSDGHLVQRQVGEKLHAHRREGIVTIRLMALQSTSKTYGPNHHAGPSERECARRRRQIAAGSLTESNGLVR